MDPATTPSTRVRDTGAFVKDMIASGPAGGHYRSIFRGVVLYSE